MDLLFQPRIKLYGNDGVTPLASGRLTFYLANTVTPSTPYINSTGTAATNPVILDSRGEAVLYLNSALTYDILVQSADLSYSYTIEDVKVGINVINGSIITDNSIQGSTKIIDQSITLAKLEGLSAKRLIGNPNNSLSGFATSFTPSADFDFIGDNLRIAPSERVSALTISSGAVTCALNTDNFRTLLLNANVTSIAFSSVPAAGRAICFSWLITQDATGGRTIAGWPASVVFPQGAYTPTSTANKRDQLTFTSFDQGVTYVCTYVKNF